MALNLTDRVRNALAGFMSNRVVGPSYRLKLAGDPSIGLSDSDRVDRYTQNKARYDNNYYDTNADGGYREDVLEALDVEDDVRLTGLYNPVTAIVDSYQNILRGRWGEEIRPADTVGGPSGKPINKVLTAKGDNVVGRIWNMSNMATRKQSMLEIGANYGMVGLRVVARPENKRVFIQVEHPATIVDFDEDERGNVTGILLEYYAEVGPLGNRDLVLVQEELDKKRFNRKVNNKQDPNVSNLPNDLGVCPYVIVRHRDRNEKWGSWAYRGSESIIDKINLLFCNISESVHEHIWATWLCIASGKEPGEPIEVGRHRMVYIEQEVDGPTPNFQAMVADLNFEGAILLGHSLIDTLAQRQPELLLTLIKALSGQSGETIAKLQTAAVSRIEGAAANYEDGLIRATQIGMSLGVTYNLWDLGTGNGAAAADAAYNDGYEDFELLPRSTLPETIFDKLQRAKYDQAAGMAKAEVAAKVHGIVDLKEQLRILGITEPARIKEIEEYIEKQKPVALEAGANNPTGQNGGPVVDPKPV